jgi:hypothetical protein
MIPKGVDLIVTQMEVLPWQGPALREALQTLALRGRQTANLVKVSHI